MSDKHRQLKESLRQYLGLNKRSDSMFFAKVESVQESTCSVEFAGMEITGVSLCATIDNNVNNLIIRPKIGSDVLIADLSGGDLRVLVVIQYTEIDNISINGGKLGGLIKIEELVKRITQIEDKLKNHQHAYIPYPGGSPGGPVATTSARQAIPPDLTLEFENTKREDIEDTKILH